MNKKEKWGYIRLSNINNNCQMPDGKPLFKGAVI